MRSITAVLSVSGFVLIASLCVWMNVDSSSQKSASIIPAISESDNRHQTEQAAQSPEIEKGAAEPVADSSWMARMQEGISQGEYRFTQQDKSVIADEPGGLHATNRARNMRAYFRADGVQIFERETSNPQWQVRWQFNAWGRGESLQTLDNVDPTANDSGSLVAFAHPGITEWYKNSEAGLEQGFTIDASPQGVGQLLLEGNVSGLTPHNHTADTVLLKDDEGRTRLQYAKLHVYDTNGQSIPARLRTNRDKLIIAVDDSAAVYPITVDPLIIPPPIGDWQVESNQGNAQIGTSVAGAGDVNGDGYDDIIAGAPSFDNGQPGEGVAFLFFGSPTGPQATGPGEANAILESDQQNAKLGSSVAGAGDVNGDGYDDVIVGGTLYDNGEDQEGIALLFLGSADGLIGSNPADAAVVIEANQTEAYLGSSVASAGDVNGDGLADVVIGAERYDGADNNEGLVLVFHGRDNSGGGSPLENAGNLAGTPGNPDNAATNLISLQRNGWMGNSVAGAGDVNADGYDDIIIGAFAYNIGESDEGVALLYLGSASGILGSDPSDAATTIEANQIDANLGHSVAGAGDVNGDGFADVIVGASGYDNNELDEGAAFLFVGSGGGLVGNTPATAAAMMESNQIICEGCGLPPLFGNSVAGAGDVNGDGYADVIVASAHYTNGEREEGSIFVFLGRDDSASGTPLRDVGTLGTTPGSPSDAVLVLEGDQGQARLGSSVAGAGDVNGDGFADLLIGSLRFDIGQNNEALLSKIIFSFS